MFELGKVFSVKAAELERLSRVRLIETCGRHRVSVLNYPSILLQKEF
jgi:hypothetical protein